MFKKHFYYPQVIFLLGMHKATWHYNFIKQLSPEHRCFRPGLDWSDTMALSSSKFSRLHPQLTFSASCLRAQWMQGLITERDLTGHSNVSNENEQISFRPFLYSWCTAPSAEKCGNLLGKCTICQITSPALSLSRQIRGQNKWVNLDIPSNQTTDILRNVELKKTEKKPHTHCTYFKIEPL